MYITENLDSSILFEVASRLFSRHEIRINGSEPLLHSDFLKTVARVKQYSIMTNGLVFINNYDYIEEEKATGIQELAISYHFDMHMMKFPVFLKVISKIYLRRFYDVI